MKVKSRIPGVPRGARSICALGLAGLIMGGCANMTPEQIQRWGCLAGTFLNVAANNFGGRYLNDAAQLVNLFVGQAPGDPTQSTQVGCQPGNYGLGVAEWAPVPGPSETPPPSGLEAEAMPGEDYSADDGLADYDQMSKATDDSSGLPPEIASDSSRFTFDVALLRPSSAGGDLIPFEDGEVLRHANADHFRIYFTPSIDAHVYVYAVDSTAWIQRLYPDEERSLRNPVRAGQQVFLPDSAHLQYGLDEYVGVQEIWFLASPRPRPEIDAALERYPIDRERPASEFRTRSGKPEYTRVTHASTFTRGLVLVGAGEPVAAPSLQTSTQQITPARLFASPSADEIAFSRWFWHE